MTTDIDDAVERLLSIENKNLEIERKPYDGISGCPPKWIPEPTINNFRKYRDTMLHDWKYSEPEAVEWIQKFTSIGDSNDNWFYPAIYPNGLELNPTQFTDVVGYLAHLKYCASLPPEEGIRLLSGKHAASGYKNAQNIRPRTVDQLTMLLEKLFEQEYRRQNEHKPSRNDMINALEVEGLNNHNSIINEVSWDTEEVYWLNNDKLVTTSFDQIGARLTPIRKKY